MTSHRIELPEPISVLLDRRSVEKGYPSVSEYVADLISRDALADARAASELRDMLQSSRDSGISERSLDDILTYARSSRRGGTQGDQS